MKELKNKIELVLSMDDIPQPEKAVKVKVLVTAKHSPTLQTLEHRYSLDNIWMTELFEK